ncbi:MAG: translocation/assembly module TamB domain-containing protein, partial [Prevotellaceae bacterium]|nr:translocation/assembly module TamB domain-containing protein [Prevotellaceae bacterium]
MKKRTTIAYSTIAAVLILLPTLLLLAVRHPRVQSYFVGWAAESLSQNLNAKVSVGAVRFRLFNRLALRDVCVQSVQGDTLLVVGELMGTLTGLSLRDRYMEVGELQLADVSLRLARDTAGVLNVDSMLSHLRKPSTNTDQPQPASMRLRVSNVSVANMTFSYTDYAARDTLPSGDGIDFRRLHVYQLALKLSSFRISGDTLLCRLDYLSCREQSGLHLRNLAGVVSVAPTFVEVKNLQLEDDYSYLNADQCRIDFDNLSDFQDFATKLRLAAHISDAQLNLNTLHYFAPQAQNNKLVGQLSGSVSGTLSNLSGRNLKLSFASQTATDVDFSVVGLPDISSAFFSVSVSKFISRSGDLMLADSLVLNARNAKHGDLLRRFGKLQGKLRFTGFLHDFVADAMLSSNIGTLAADLSCSQVSDSLMALNATLGVGNFNVGRLLGDTLVGHVTMHGNVDGTIKNLSQLALNLDFNIPSCELKGYRYRSAKLRGVLTESSFRGMVACADTNMRFDLRGIATFGKARPHYNAALHLHHADFVATGLNPRDSVSQLQLNMSVNLEGSSPDSLVGKLHIANVLYVSSSDSMALGAIEGEAQHADGVQRYALRSELANAELTAKGSVKNILPVLDSALRTYIPQYRTMLLDNPPVLVCDDVCEYTFLFETKKAAAFQDALFRNFAVADSSSFSGHISSDVSRNSLSVRSPYIRYAGMALSEFSLHTTLRDSVLQLEASADSVNFNDFILRNWTMGGALHRGELMFNMGYTSTAASGSVVAQLVCYENWQGKKSVDVTIFPSTLALGEAVWELSKSRINIENGRYMVDNLHVENRDQLFFVNGIVSSQMSDTLQCELRNFDIEPLIRTFSKSPKVNLDGAISGTVTIGGMLAQSPLILTDIRVDTLKFFDKLVGDVQLRTAINNDIKGASVFLNITKNNAEILNVAGSLNNKWELDADAKLSSMELMHVEPLIATALTDIDGTLSGNIKISGHLKNLMLNGPLTLDNVQLRVCYTNALYKVNGAASMENSAIHVRNVTGYDDKNRSFKINFMLGNLTTPPLFYTLKVAPVATHVVSTTEQLNDHFYGQGYATGTVQINGRSGEADINIAVATNENTTISIPLGAKAQAQSQSFIRFMSPSATPTAAKPVAVDDNSRPSNVHAEIDINVTNDAEVMLVLNPLTGDVLKGSGTGNVKIVAEPAKGTFRVMGSYTIQRGEYSISIQNLVSKKFKIESGSTIS